VDERIKELAQLKRQLGELRQQCQSEREVRACGIMHGLAAMTVEAGGEHPAHLVHDLGSGHRRPEADS
jgi:hypothetical protein